jgi:hypothetical protein
MTISIVDKSAQKSLHQLIAFSPIHQFSVKFTIFSDEWQKRFHSLPPKNMTLDLCLVYDSKLGEWRVWVWVWVCVCDNFSWNITKLSRCGISPMWMEGQSFQPRRFENGIAKISNQWEPPPTHHTLIVSISLALSLLYTHPTRCFKRPFFGLERFFNLRNPGFCQILDRLIGTNLVFGIGLGRFWTFQSVADLCRFWPNAQTWF